MPVLEVLCGNLGNDASSRVASQLGLLVQSELQELVAQRHLLVVGKRSPVLDNELAGLDGGELLQALVGVAAENLEQGIERCGRVVVVLVQSRRGVLDNVGVSCRVLTARTSGGGCREDLTLQQALKQLNKLLLVHGGAFTEKKCRSRA